MTTYDSGAYLSQHANQFVPTIQLFALFLRMNSSEYFLQVLQVGGLPILALLTMLLVYFYDSHNTKKINSWYWAVIIISGLALINPASQILWDSFKPLQMIQFPWRMLLIINLASVILLTQLVKRPLRFQFLVPALLVLSITYSIYGYAHSKGTSSRSDYEWYQATTTTSSSDEHKPVWFTLPSTTIPEISFISQQSSTTPSELIQIENIQIYRLDGTVADYSIIVPTDGLLLHKRAYFPGWEAIVDTIPTKIKYESEQFKGLVMIPVTAGNHHVRLSFSNSTTTRSLGLILTVTGAICLLLLVVSESSNRGYKE
jgi:hypothetical protein